MANIEAPENLQDLPLSVIKNMIMLATSGFGVVVALAWNEFIKSFVDNYISPILGKNSGMVSLFIYAVLMTLLAVVVTMQLASVQKKLELLHAAGLKPAPTPVQKKRAKPQKRNTR